MLYFALLCFAVASRAMLPPGYEDEIYCPVGMCLERAHHDRGWSGPMTMYKNCVNISDQTTMKPRGWGSNVDISIKKKIIADGWIIAHDCQAITRGLFISNAFNSLL